MTVGNILYTIVISPLQLVFEIIFMMANKVIENPGLSIIVLSLTMNFLVLPLYRRADAMQEEERNKELLLKDGVSHIKKTFKGDERMMILQTYYRQNDYRPTDVFKGALSLFLEIPFFIAAYQFLSHLGLLKGAAFFVFQDLGSPDALIHIGSFTINILPIIMTGVNLISCIIFTKGYPLKTKIQLYSMAIFFFFFLYNSPSGLVFYWTLNNLFSLLKTIFYKLKHAKEILMVMFSVAGIAICGASVKFFASTHMKRFVITMLIGVLLTLPLIISVLYKRMKKDGKAASAYTNPHIYTRCCLFMAVFVGVLIPSALLAASPQEFTDVYHFYNPIWYVVSSACLAFGAFVLWGGIFYRLANDAVKKYFDYFALIICGVSVIDYMFFGKNLGILDKTLQFEEGIHYTAKTMLINVLVLACVVAVLSFGYTKERVRTKYIKQVMAILVLAVVAMPALNLFNINKAIDDMKKTVSESEGSMPTFKLSKNGQNVVVIMLDRAMNIYFPYLVEEKPEIKEMFAGFTNYTNTLSYGPLTNIGSPGLYGGYEYTPYEMNKRDTESLKDKQNEALKVMPVIFNDSGYDVTVMDPTYANYQNTPDLSIYSEYPEIATYITNGRYVSEDMVQLLKTNNKRNFFCYSILKVLPPALQGFMYNDGQYFHANENDTVYGRQNMHDNFQADGMNTLFTNPYAVLENLSDITNVVDDSTNTFMMMSNDTTHEPMILQEPDYVPADKVDNTEYEEKMNYQRTDGQGNTLDMSELNRAIHYQANMAAILKIGEWLDYLKENDVYDNTRIIIVADHGRHIDGAEGYVENNSQDAASNLEFYQPLLLVKDFKSNQFAYSDEFMTNADVPTLAVKDLIENATNPFTGKIINNEEKNLHDQYVLGSLEFDIAKNNGNKFLPGKWFSVHDNVHEVENWKVIDQSTDMPNIDGE